MAVERAAGGTSLIDVLDRVLDKGIVIDAWVRVSLVGIDLITVEARVVVASIDTYLKYSEAVGQVSPVSRPAGGAAVAPGSGGGERRAARGAGGVEDQPRRPLRRRRKPAHTAPALRVRGLTPRGTCRPRRWRRFTESIPEAKLAFVEFLLTSIDVQESARRGVDWLVAHAPVTRGRRARAGGHLERDAAGRRARRLERRDHGLRAEPRRRTAIRSSRP